MGSAAVHAPFQRRSQMLPALLVHAAEQQGCSSPAVPCSSRSGAEQSWAGSPVLNAGGEDGHIAVACRVGAEQCRVTVRLPQRQSA